MEPVIITAALTGAQQGKDANPALPEQPAEIIDAAVECAAAGAAIVHVHARDRDGRPTADPDVFRLIVDGIRARCDVVLNLTTGGAVAGLALAERIAVVGALRPEIASLSLGSGALLARGDRYVPLLGSYAEMREVAAAFRAAGTKPELEIYHAGMLGNLALLHGEGAFAEPLWVNLVTGIPGEVTPPEIAALLPLIGALPPGARWLVSGIGARNHFRMAAAAALLGGHVRVGLEDNVYLEPGRLAASNAELVERAARLLADLGRRPASSAEARRLLALRSP